MIFHSRSSGRSLKKRTKKDELALNVHLNALEGNFKLEWVLEVAWVVQDYNITDMDLNVERIKTMEQKLSPWP